MRVLKRWRRVRSLDPGASVFIAAAKDPPPWSFINQLIRLDLRVVMIGVEGAYAAADLARLALDPEVPQESFSMDRLRAHRLLHLRQRRDELAALRERLNSAPGHMHRFGQEIDREFERMDRSHSQLLDRHMARLDTLIRLQWRGAS